MLYPHVIHVPISLFYTKYRVLVAGTVFLVAWKFPLSGISSLFRGYLTEGYKRNLRDVRGFFDWDLCGNMTFNYLHSRPKCWISYSFASSAGGSDIFGGRTHAHLFNRHRHTSWPLHRWVRFFWSFFFCSFGYCIFLRVGRWVGTVVGCVLSRRKEKPQHVHM